MTVQSHHHVESGILLREFKAAGFDCQLLGIHPLFQAAMREYGAYRMTLDGLLRTAENLAVFDKRLKPATTIKTLEVK